MKSCDLKKQIATLDGQEQELKSQISSCQRDLTVVKKASGDLRKELVKKEKKASKPLDVTDHAVVQYLERVLGINIKNLKREIMPEGTRVLIEKYGDGKYKREKYELVVENNQVVTILTELKKAR